MARMSSVSLLRNQIKVRLTSLNGFSKRLCYVYCMISIAGKQEEEDMSLTITLKIRER